nr:50S ribosomal protein L11 methyltransferase [Rubrivivax gelatinosus]
MNAAELLAGQGLSPEAEAFVQAIAGQPDLADRLARMASVFRQRDRRRDSLLLAHAARRLAPGDQRIRVRTEWLLRHEAPLWHFGIIHDRPRNKIYARALQHWVRPGMTVFEIGTGTGLLAMLAVRAGAHHVYTCERRADVAEAAREIVARNGLAERITVIAKDAHAVTLGSDLPARCDLFVAEIVDNTLLGEDVLPLTELARERFLVPDAPLLPQRVSAIGALVAGTDIAESGRMSTAMGFDLTPFNRFSPTELSAGPGGGAARLLSGAVELIGFDLAHDTPALDQPQRLRLVALQAGRAEGVMRWLRLDFGAGIVFENTPPQRSSWFPCIHLLPEARDLAAGDELQLDLQHDRARLYLTPA